MLLPIPDCVTYSNALNKISTTIDKKRKENVELSRVSQTFLLYCLVDLKAKLPTAIGNSAEATLN